LQARECIFLFDSKGLVVRDRSEELEYHKLPFIQDGSPCTNLLDAVKQIKCDVRLPFPLFSRRSSSGMGCTSAVGVPSAWCLIGRAAGGVGVEQHMTRKEISEFRIFR
jgi:hypothetical protein